MKNNLKLQLRVHQTLMCVNAIIGLLFSIFGMLIAFTGYATDILSRKMEIITFCLCIIVVIISVINAYRYDESVTKLQRKIAEKGV